MIAQRRQFKEERSIAVLYFSDYYLVTQNKKKNYITKCNKDQSLSSKLSSSLSPDCSLPGVFSTIIVASATLPDNGVGPDGDNDDDDDVDPDKEDNG